MKAFFSWETLGHCAKTWFKRIILIYFGGGIPDELIRVEKSRIRKEEEKFEYQIENKRYLARSVQISRHFRETKLSVLHSNANSERKQQNDSSFFSLPVPFTLILPLSLSLYLLLILSCSLSVSNTRSLIFFFFIFFTKTWNEKSGFPNCLRVLTYSRDKSYMACAPPMLHAPFYKIQHRMSEVSNFENKNENTSRSNDNEKQIIKK